MTVRVASFVVAVGLSVLSAVACGNSKGSTDQNRSGPTGTVDAGTSSDPARDASVSQPGTDEPSDEGGSDASNRSTVADVQPVDVSVPVNDARPPPPTPDSGTVDAGIVSSKDAGGTPDVVTDASPCSPVAAVFAPSLLGQWDCAVHPCMAAPPLDANFGCREPSDGGGYIYRTRECWDQWHPGSPAGDAVDFTKEYVATGCVQSECGEEFAYEGAISCGSDVHVTARRLNVCDSCDADCNAQPVAVIVPNEIATVEFTLEEPRSFSFVEILDSGVYQCLPEGPPWCLDPSDPTNDECWRGCESDFDCTLVAANCCGCESGGQRVAIRSDQAARWPSSYWSCSDGCDTEYVCDDCTAGYAGAQAACVNGMCSVACDGSISCPDLERSIVRERNEVTSCTSDADCEKRYDPLCGNVGSVAGPFGCWSPVHENADLSNLFDLERSFLRQCASVIECHDCPGHPSTACIDGQCIVPCPSGCTCDTGFACSDPSIAPCLATGGRWDEWSCGHYSCGVRPDCQAIIPGCDCGSESNFVDGFGCNPDTACGQQP